MLSVGVSHQVGDQVQDAGVPADSEMEVSTVHTREAAVDGIQGNELLFRSASSRSNHSVFCHFQVELCEPLDFFKNSVCGSQKLNQNEKKKNLEHG